MFLYHAGLGEERMVLRAPEMRSANGGARRVSSQVRKEKVLGHHASSKKQQQELCRLAIVRAQAVDRKRYFRRGAAALAKLHVAERQRQEQLRFAAAKRKVKLLTHI